MEHCSRLTSSYLSTAMRCRALLTSGLWNRTCEHCAWCPWGQCHLLCP